MVLERWIGLMMAPSSKATNKQTYRHRHSDFPGEDRLSEITKKCLDSLPEPPGWLQLCHHDGCNCATMIAACLMTDWPQIKSHRQTSLNCFILEYSLEDTRLSLVCMFDCWLCYYAPGTASIFTESALRPIQSIGRNVCLLFVWCFSVCRLCVTFFIEEIFY